MPKRPVAMVKPFRRTQGAATCAGIVGQLRCLELRPDRFRKRTVPGQDRLEKERHVPPRCPQGDAGGKADMVERIGRHHLPIRQAIALGLGQAGAVLLAIHCEAGSVHGQWTEDGRLHESLKGLAGLLLQNRAQNGQRPAAIGHGSSGRRDRPGIPAAQRSRQILPVGSVIGVQVFDRIVETGCVREIIAKAGARSRHARQVQRAQIVGNRRVDTDARGLQPAQDGQRRHEFGDRPGAHDRVGRHRQAILQAGRAIAFQQNRVPGLDNHNHNAGNIVLGLFAGDEVRHSLSQYFRVHLSAGLRGGRHGEEACQTGETGDQAARKKHHRSLSGLRPRPTGHSGSSDADAACAPSPRPGAHRGSYGRGIAG